MKRLNDTLGMKKLEQMNEDPTQARWATAASCGGWGAWPRISQPLCANTCSSERWRNLLTWCPGF